MSSSLAPFSPSARGVALGTLANYARFLVSALVFLFLTPAMVRHLGAEDYGLWSLAFSVVGFLSLLDLGVGTGVVKCVAEAAGSGDAARRNRMLSTYGAAGLLIATLAGVLLAALALGFGRIFAIPQPARARAVATLLLVGLRAVVLAVPLGLFRGVLFGAGRLLTLNAIQAATLVGYGCVTLLALEHGAGIVGVALCGLAWMLVEHALYALFAARAVPGLRLHPRLVDRSLIGEALALSASQLLIAVSGLVLLRTDPVVVQITLGLSAVGVYAIALKAAENGFVLVKQFVNALTPLVARLHGAGRSADLRTLLLRGTRVAMLPAAGLAVATTCAGPRALALWLGPGFEAAAAPMIVLVLAMVLTVPQMVVFNLFTFTGRHRLPARAAIGAAALNLIATLVLVHPFGLLGVALGTLVATLVVDVCWVLRAACIEFEVGAREYLRCALWPAVMPAAAQALVTSACLAWWPPQSLLAIALSCGAGGLAFLLALGPHPGLAEERALLLGWWRPRLAAAGVAEARA